MDLPLDGGRAQGLGQGPLLLIEAVDQQLTGGDADLNERRLSGGDRRRDPLADLALDGAVQFAGTELLAVARKRAMLEKTGRT